MSIDIKSPEASERSMRFLASLTSEATDAQRVQAWDDLCEVMTGPVETNTVLSVLVAIGGGMLEAATGRRADLYSFQISTPFGPVPVDSAPPAMRWVGRWFAASLNQDYATAADLWFTDAEPGDAKAAVDVMVPSLITFLTTAVRSFLAAGNPFPTDFTPRMGGGS